VSTTRALDLQVCGGKRKKGRKGKEWCSGLQRERKEKRDQGSVSERKRWGIKVCEKRKDERLTPLSRKRGGWGEEKAAAVGLLLQKKNSGIRGTGRGERKRKKQKRLSSHRLSYRAEERSGKGTTDHIVERGQRRERNFWENVRLDCPKKKKRVPSKLTYLGKKKKGPTRSERGGERR